MPTNNKFFRPIFFFALLGAIYFLGFLHGHQNLKFENKLQPELVNRELKKPTEIDFSLFWEVYDKVNQEYVDKVDPKKALEGAVRGLVNGLEDPYSVYLTKDESKQFLDDLNGQFEGIGAELTITDEVISVVAPLKESPAEKAGLQTGDKILSIDDKETVGMSLPEAVTRIRGQRGTSVKIIILKKDQSEPKTLQIKRDVIKIESVSLSWPKEGYALLKVTQFGEDTSSLMQKFAREITTKNAKGLILDLRNNPGGLLDSSIDMASLFVESGKTVVITKDADGDQTEDRTTFDPLLKDVPLVVLINEGSASASEIVAGAIQDYQRGKIVGRKSFGKGSVQNLIDLKDGGTLRLTIAQWLTPNGRTISHEGIKPDIEGEDDSKTESDELIEKALSTFK